MISLFSVSMNANRIVHPVSTDRKWHAKIFVLILVKILVIQWKRKLLEDANNFLVLFYFAMKSHLIELRTKFHEFEPFRIVSTVFCSCVARDSWLTFLSSGCRSAFSALECDNDANAFAFSHGNSLYVWE